MQNGAYEAEVERRAQEARRVSEEIAGQEPSAQSWGVFAYGDAPAAIGGGFGSFLWFASRAALLDYLSEHIAFCPAGPRGRDHLAVAASCAAVIQKMNTDANRDADHIEELNGILKGYSQIQWMGTLTALERGEGNFAQEVLKSFFGVEPGSSERRLGVSKDKESDFREFIQTYGF